MWVFQLYNQASIDSHLGCLQSSAVTNSAAMNNPMHVLFTCGSLSSVQISNSGITGLKVNLSAFPKLNYRGCTILTLLQAMHEAAYFSTIKYFQTFDTTG